MNKNNRHPADGKKPITIFGPDFPFAFDDWIEHPAGLGSIPAERHGEEVATISRHISEATRQQATAGNEIASQVEGIVAGIDQTTGAIDGVSRKTVEMEDGASVAVAGAFSFPCLLPSGRR